MIQYRDFAQSLTGQWHEILSMYGIEVPKMRGKNSVNGPCPCCGGDDRAHWRESDGRLALFCRSCTSGSMKSPEQVIQEVCSIGFNELVHNLADFVNYRTPEDIKKAKKRVSAMPKRNTPNEHKQDHDKSVEFLGRCELKETFPVLLSKGVQHPEPIYSMSGNPIFEIHNESGALVNLACLNEKGVSFIAGGLSYGGWTTVNQCKQREVSGVAWCSDIVGALHHWWATGQKTRITFNTYNTIWMLNVGIIKTSDELILLDEEKPLIDGNQ